METIGDAYMLATGIMEPTASAIEKMANMALAMQLAIKKIQSPLRQDSIKVELN